MISLDGFNFLGPSLVGLFEIKQFATDSLPVIIMKNSLILSILLVNASFGGVINSITWQPSQSISGDSDVNTQGSLLYAYNVGASGVSDATVNGVAFLAYAFPADYTTNTVTVGSVSMTESPGYLVSSNTLGGGSAPFTSLTSGYQALLGSGGLANLPTSITVTFSGLTASQQYLVQWWSNNSGNGKIDGYLGLNDTTATSGLTSATLDANTTNTVGGLGQYVTGTFTANSSTYSMELAATALYSDAPLINAFQVRAIPEPSSLALLAAGCGVVVLRRRRK